MHISSGHNATLEFAGGSWNEDYVNYLLDILALRVAKQFVLFQ